MAAREILLIRHAESLWNAEGRWQGQEDPPLSARGLEQAEALAAALAGAGVERIVDSDLRAPATPPQPLARALGLPAQLDPRLRELDVGRWGGRTRAEIAAQRRGAAGALRPRRPRRARRRRREPRAAARARARRAARDLAAAARTPGCVALVTHLGWLREVLPGRRLRPRRVASRRPASPWLAVALTRLSRRCRAGARWRRESAALTRASRPGAKRLA